MSDELRQEVVMRDITGALAPVDRSLFMPANACGVASTSPQMMCWKFITEMETTATMSGRIYGLYTVIVMMKSTEKSTHDRSYITEEPDEGKLSRPVL